MAYENHESAVEFLFDALHALEEQGYDYVANVQSSTNDNIAIVDGDPNTGILPPNEFSLDHITIKLFKDGKTTTVNMPEMVKDDLRPGDSLRFEALIFKATERMLPSEENPPQPQEYPKLNLHDEATSLLTRQDLVDVGLKIDSHLKHEDLEGLTRRIYVEKKVAETTVFSSTGIFEKFKSTYFEVNCDIQKLQMEGEFFFKTRDASEFDPDAYGKMIRDTAFGKLHDVEDFEPGEYTTVFCPEMVAILMKTFLFHSHNAKSILEGSSRYTKDDLGERKYRPGLTIYIDGALDNGVQSAPYDSEGTPTGRRYLVADGDVCFWGHKKYAEQLGMEELGEADGFRNLRIEPWEDSPTHEEMLTQDGKVIYITCLNAIHTKTSAEKGEFDVSVRSILYEDGKMKGKLDVVINGADFYKMLGPEGNARISSDTVAGMPVIETKLHFNN